MDRKAELERKRQKIAELRRAREERKQVATSDAPRLATEKDDVDQLVNALVGDTITETKQTALAAPAADLGVASLPTESSDHGVKSALAEPEPFAYVMRPPPALVLSEFVMVELPPTVGDCLSTLLPYMTCQFPMTYSKEAQTTASSFDVEDIPGSVKSQAFIDPLTVKPANSELKEAVDPINAPRRGLKDEEREAIVQSDNFQSFFHHSSKLIEKTLTSEKYDALRDYSAEDATFREVAADKGVKLVMTFTDERWSKGRSVTDVSWSPKYPELLLCSYNKNRIAVNEPDGLVLLWTSHLPERPEFVFQSQSDVLVARFSDFHPHLVIGGTYSGQIVLWDTRAKSLPVLKTPLSATGHTHPVYCMEVTGTQNAHSVVTVSTDGLVCSWSLDMLAHPQDTLDLINTTHMKTDEVAVTTMGFPANETGTFWVGTEEGSIYQANRYDLAGSKAGINAKDIYTGHSGMVTGLHFHPNTTTSELNDLFVTSSVDWTVKLWRSKPTSKSTSGPHQISPIHSFDDADDYIYDVKWSPIHPSVFGCVDGSGRLALYDISQETEAPVASVPVGNQRALSKLSWDLEGGRLAVGSSDGQCHVFNIGDMSRPGPDAVQSMATVLKEIEASRE